MYDFLKTCNTNIKIIYAETSQHQKQLKNTSNYLNSINSD